MAPGFQIALNATIYYANISSDTPLNTPVYRIRAIINSTLYFLDMSISLSQTQQINALLEFEGGVNDRITVTESDLATIDEVKVFDTSINLVAEPGTDFEYPVELGIDIQLVVLTGVEVTEQVVSSGIGYIILEAPGQRRCLSFIWCIVLNKIYGKHVWSVYTCIALKKITLQDCERVCRIEIRVSINLMYGWCRCAYPVVNFVGLGYFMCFWYSPLNCKNVLFLQILVIVIRVKMEQHVSRLIVYFTPVCVYQDTLE